MSSCFPCDLLIRAFLPVLRHCTDALHCRTVLDFGPVSLPDVFGLPIISVQQTGDGVCKPFPAPIPPSPDALSVSCFPLSRLTPELLDRHLSAMHRSAPFSLFADFKMAERNIELPSCLLMGGIRRFCQKDDNAFISLTGLEGMLYREEKRFRVMARHTLMGGALACILAENISS